MSDLRRATGRRGAIPGVVVRGSVRVIAAVVTPLQLFSVEDLRPRDYQRWRDLRGQLRQREEARRQQWRFRKNPAVYLADIEARLLGTKPSDAGQERSVLVMEKEQKAS